MSPFIAGRIISLFGFGLFVLGLVVWMARENMWLRGMPVLTGALHGMVFYGVYLTVYFWFPQRFDLQEFANWGSIFVMQAAFTGTFIVWDMVFDFSRLLLRAFRRWPVFEVVFG